MSNGNTAKKILVVEDEAQLAQVLDDEFTRAGFTILRAEDGEAGLSLALKEHPDLILLDVVMPKLDGFEVMRRLREDAWGKDARIIVLTNLGMDAKLTQAMNDYKPLLYLVKTDWPLNDLIHKVQEVL